MTRAGCVKNAGPDLAIPADDEPTDIRVDKVRAIRRQLREGTYHVEDRLDVVVERIIENLS